MTPEQRLAWMQASLKFAGTPGRPGVGLAAAADTYAKTLLEAQGLQQKAASTQSEAERSRAQAKLAEQEAVSKQFVAGPGGYARFTPEEGGGVKIEVPRMPQAGAATVVGGDGKTTTGGARPPEAPTGPSDKPEAVRQVFDFSSLSGNENPEEKLRIMKSMGEEIGQKAWGTSGEQLKKDFAEANGQAQSAGRAATDAYTDLKALAKSVTGIPTSGPLTAGAAADLRYNVANYLNTFAGAFGQSLGATSDNLSSKEILDKLKVLSTQERQRGLGREAGFWLQTLSQAYPSAGMTKDSANSLTADLIVANRRTQDRAQVYSLYGQYSNYAGANAEDVFRATNPSNAYLRDKEIIQDLLKRTKVVDGKPQNLITLLQSGQLTPEQFNEIVRKQKGVTNLSRYFGS
jgi:hypothetical protein